jgi:DNA (cytosine-5)-methyltransferase 1
LNGLDLFAGYGGLSLGLAEWVNPVAYCEIDKYAQAILLSRMSEGRILRAPIWDDITTFPTSEFENIDIVYGGFPCQDISCAGRGAGLEGKRSGLFFELCRVVEEINPRFIFLENVAGIRTKGLREIIRTLTNLRYDCRWTCVSAAEVGAKHIRKRWFLLGYSKHHGSLETEVAGCNDKTLDSWCKKRTQEVREFEGTDNRLHIKTSNPWLVEPNVDRVVDGYRGRVDRIKALGNGVVPLQAKTAFERLIGIDI